jgi:hypothetical protein
MKQNRSTKLHLLNIGGGWFQVIFVYGDTDEDAILEEVPDTWRSSSFRSFEEARVAVFGSGDIVGVYAQLQQRKDLMKQYRFIEAITLLDLAVQNNRLPRENVVASPTIERADRQNYPEIEVVEISDVVPEDRSATTVAGFTLTPDDLDHDVRQVIASVM